MRKSILNMVLAAATVATTATGIAQAATLGAWTKIASQGTSFTVTGTTKKIVRFGAGTSWTTKGVVGNAQCTSAFFSNKDPAPGVAKRCEIFTASATTALPVSYNIKLNWSIPTTRQNGQALPIGELKGYEVYYATDNSTSTANDTVVAVSGGSINTSTISKLPAGTYYFSVSAIDINGLKSPLSTMISTKVGG
jgi:hypothetical protein